MKTNNSKMALDYKVDHINNFSEEQLDIEVILYPINGNFDEDDYISCNVHDDISIGYTIITDGNEEEFLNDEEEEKVHIIVKKYLANLIMLGLNLNQFSL
jgi:hypothetical protein